MSEGEGAAATPVADPVANEEPLEVEQAAEEKEEREDTEDKENKEDAGPKFEEKRVPIQLQTDEFPPKGFVGVDVMDATQQEFDLKWGTGMGECVEHAFLSKDSILTHIDKRGAASDWNSAAKQLRKYKGETVLIVKLSDEKSAEHDVNYLLSIKPEAFDEYKAIIEAQVGAAKNAFDEEQKAKKAEKKAAREDGEDGEVGDSDEEDDEPPALADVSNFERKPLIARVLEDTTGFKDVDKLKVVNNRPLLGFYITQQRRKFGARHEFNDFGNDKPTEYRRQKIPGYDVELMEIDIGFQAAASQKDGHTQTNAVGIKINKATQYQPVNFPAEEAASILHSDAMKAFLANVEARCSQVLQSNETIDLFKDEFKEFEEEEVSLGNRAENNLKELHSFTDLIHSKNKNISAICWHPSIAGEVAFACTNNLTFDQWVEVSGKVLSSSILIWNFQDLLHPQLILEVPGNLMCFKLNTHNPNLVVGGLSTGQVIYWDLTDAKSRLADKSSAKADNAEADNSSDVAIPPVKPIMLSVIDRSHARSVTDIVWLPHDVEVNKKGEIASKPEQTYSNQFVTLAGDGNMLFWDVRVNHWKNPNQLAKEEHDGGGYKWMPVASIPLTRPESGSLVPAIKLTLAGESEVLCVTEDGDVLNVDWNGKVGNEDKGKPETVRTMVKGHFQAGTTVEKSPHFPDIYMTVGDWSFKIWKVDQKEPVFISPCAEYYLATARWSPTRPGIIITARVDGSIDVWDLVDQGHKASLNFSTGSDPITSMEFWQSSHNVSVQYLAVGDSSGKLHVIDMPRNLRRKLPNEEAMMRSFYDREIKRVDYVNKRKEIRQIEMREKKKAGGGDGDAAAKGGENKAADEAAKKKSDELAAAEATYQKILKSFKETLMKDDDNE